ncbi:MAG: pseudouridine synthase [Candidatus Sumerlaeaceae bacterium]
MGKLKQKLREEQICRQGEAVTATSQAIRLHKFLAQCGYGSRRSCEEMIRQGRVVVNGLQVREMGVKIVPGRDCVAVDGKPVLTLREPLAYYVINKPPGYITSRQDERGRPTVFELLRDVPEHVFPVGRLDKDSEGLLLLTNDGELAHRLMHPSFRVEKEYWVEVQGYLDEEAISRLESGLTFEGVRYEPARVRLISRSPEKSYATITISEGKKRQVRRMCLAVGHPVQRLVRIREGCLVLNKLRPGEYRRLTPSEIHDLRREARLDPVPEDQ